jgi:hypothetical protein
LQANQLDRGFGPGYIFEFNLGRIEMALALVQQQTLGLNQDALEEWIEYREFKKKPLSELALKKSKNMLLRYPEEHQQHIVDTAIMNDWQGLHPVDMPKTKPTIGDTSWIENLT